MALTLYHHPLASFCHKVLIGLYENETPFESVVVDLSDPVSSKPVFDAWPVGKIPVLRDRERTIAETTIQLEYLDTHFPGPVPLFPRDPERALAARLWDRFFDCYVQTPMQKCVADVLRAEGRKDPTGVEDAHATLRTAYQMLEQQLAEGPFVSGAFSVADCAAAPALFYARVVVPFAPEQARLAAYFERLLARPSVARVLEEAKPYLQFYPLLERLEARFKP